MIVKIFNWMEKTLNACSCFKSPSTTSVQAEVTVERDIRWLKHRNSKPWLWFSINRARESCWTSHAIDYFERQQIVILTFRMWPKQNCSSLLSALFSVKTLSSRYQGFGNLSFSGLSMRKMTCCLELYSKKLLL